MKRMSRASYCCKVHVGQQVNYSIVLSVISGGPTIVTAVYNKSEGYTRIGRRGNWQALLYFISCAAISGNIPSSIMPSSQEDPSPVKKDGTFQNFNLNEPSIADASKTAAAPVPAMTEEEYDNFFQGYWRDLPEEYLRQVESRCKDAEFCESMMLSEEDDLSEVLERDEATLLGLSITRKQIADVLETIKVLACEGDGADFEPKVILNGRFAVETLTYRGSQPSPFQHPDDQRYYGIRWGCQNVRVLCRRYQKVFSFSTLLIPMIRYNGFFEGNIRNGTYNEIESFRIDPEQVVDFFGIQPNIDYSLGFETRKQWRTGKSGPQSLEYQNLVEALALEKAVFSNGDVAYLSWLPVVFSSECDTIIYPTSSLKPPVDVSKIEWDKLMSCTSEEEKMDYIVDVGAAEWKITEEEYMDYIVDVGAAEWETTESAPKASTLESIARWKVDSNGDDDEHLTTLAMVMFRQAKHAPNIETVFGAELHRQGLGRRSVRERGEKYSVASTPAGAMSLIVESADQYIVGELCSYEKLVAWNQSIGMTKKDTNETC